LSHKLEPLIIFSSNPPSPHVLIVFKVMDKNYFLKVFFILKYFKIIFLFLKFIFNIKRSKQFKNIKNQISRKKIQDF
jgi:hypothetical protein